MNTNCFFVALQMYVGLMAVKGLEDMKSFHWALDCVMRANDNMKSHFCMERFNMVSYISAILTVM